jgi:NAD(P)-dependent dehydrogenase (short-subunit alcohol dehydrogenase family)
MVRRLVDHVADQDADCSGIKTIVYGGGPMYLEDIRRALDVLGDRLVQIYGQGESPMTITALSRRHLADRAHPRHRERIASVGVAHSVVEVVIADTDDQPLPAGTTGEVLVRGETVMQGYWRNPEATAATLRNGWLHTGDIGSLDADGFLTLKDRSKDVIISGGANIYPREVEEVLLRHAAVAEVSVVGRPNAEWGEEVVAFIVCQPGVSAPIAELDRLCLDSIARFKRPKDYIFVAALPRNNYGKVLKTAVAAPLDSARRKRIMSGRLQDKVAIVTGSGSIGPGWGNGKAMSVFFAREGARVVGADIDAEAGAATQQIIDDEGWPAFVVVADVARAADVERLVATALDTYGRIDILVNNVGIAVVGGPAELDEATWDRLMSINLKSAYLTCHHVLPVMIRQHAGAIVNNASVAVLGWAGVNYGFYAASKGAMVAMTRTMAIRHAPDGIRANCVLPGLMNTPLVHAALTRVYGEDGDIANLIRTRDAQCPLGHMGDAWDTAYAASDAISPPPNFLALSATSRCFISTSHLCHRTRSSMATPASSRSPVRRAPFAR